MSPDGSLDAAVARWIQQNGLDSVDGAFAYADGEDLSKPGLGFRRRTRVRFTDDAGRPWECYLKRYGPIPAGVLLRRIVSGRGRSCEALVEFRNIRAIGHAGVPTMQGLAAGAEMTPLGPRRSYLLVSSVPGDALERTAQAFLDRHADCPDRLSALTAALTDLVRTFHASGFVHRDLYAAHIFLHEQDERIELNLIDLARAFQPCWRTFRWRVKDLAQLKYSMPAAWVSRDWETFLAGYLGPERSVERDRWARAIDRKVASMVRQQQRRQRRKANA